MLAAVKAKMGPAEVEAAVAATAALKAAQAGHDSPAQLATIPSLSLADLSPVLPPTCSCPPNTDINTPPIHRYPVCVGTPSQASALPTFRR